MSKEDIIFFDALGCGWIIDAETIKKIAPREMHDQSVSERILFDHVYCDAKDMTR